MGKRQQQVRKQRETARAIEAILESRPLAGTLAVLHFMRDAARKDPLCYAACSAFLESTGEDRHSAGDFFERLAANYEPKAVQFMAQHAQMDERYEHVGFLEKICREMNDIDMARADRAVRYLSGFVETLELWSTVVERHYSTNPPLPVGSVRIYGAPTAMTGERA